MSFSLSPGAVSCSRGGKGTSSSGQNRPLVLVQAVALRCWGGGQACAARFRPYCDAQQLWRRGAESAVKLSLLIIDAGRVRGRREAPGHLRPG